VLFEETSLKGAFIVHPEPHSDERGFFARVWCKREFENEGLNPRLVQSSISYNKLKGTLRGMHYQVAPHAEAKLVRCTRGSIFDVVIDLRDESPTFKQWVGVELTEENRDALYVPEGFGHGFLTLEDDCEILYNISEYYAPDAERGLRFDDPAIGIEWPLRVKVISTQDASWPVFGSSESDW
jgi:dTDP-4-dehydrorhamnose 3,5-epimerase